MTPTSFQEAVDRIGLLLQSGRLREAEDAGRRLLASHNQEPAAWGMLGTVLRHAGRLGESEGCYRKVIEMAPGHALAWSELGVVLGMRGRLLDCVGALRRAIELKPDFAQALYNLASALGRLGRREESMAALERAVAVRPDYAEALALLAVRLRELGELERAAEMCRRAVAAKPGFAEGYTNLGLVLQKQGRNEEAVAALRQAVAIGPNPSVHSALLVGLHYLPAVSPAEIFQEHLEWARRCGGAEVHPEHRNSREPDRRLRVGLISPDFREHSVAFFIEPILAAHDRGEFEFICYSDVAGEDERTRRLKGLADTWREVAALSDERVAAVIMEDGVDVLIELAGHTAGNRLLAVARRPAPVQVTYLGYPNTTGLGAVDYRITDGVADPVGATEGLHSERLVRLIRGAWCYRPPEESPAPRAPDESEGVTFGSFNNLAKINGPWIGVWAKILLGCEGARLMLKNSSLRDAGTRRRIIEGFAAQGVSSDRLLLREPQVELVDHLAAYHAMDVALDTFPYHGTTTTCEAMWMGVPVVSLEGEAHVSRVGASLLTTVGLGDLVARSNEEYIAIAIALGRDGQRRAELRRTLRKRMKASALMDETGFARDFGGALRWMWKQWCFGQEQQLGVGLGMRGQVEESIAALRRAVEIDGSNADAWSNLGTMLQTAGRLDEAENACRRAVELDAMHAQANCTLASICDAQGRTAEAIARARRAIARRPDFAEAYCNLASALAGGMAGLDEAIAACQWALEIRADFPEAHNNLGVILQKQGRVEQGIAELKKAIAQRPSFAGAHSNLLMALHYVETDPREIYEEHVKWGRLHGHAARSGKHRDAPVAEKRLRVGLVSADFREHSVAFFLEPLLARHDREQFEFVCYSDVMKPDGVTERFKRQADGWREIRGIGNERLAALVEEDAVDVLIDLAGHTSGNRLMVFAGKPAPVQASWLGYADTTGLSAIDYRITDAVADPPGAESFYTEQLVRMGRTAWCYRAPECSPDVGPGPGGVTFGSFHTLEKITPRWLGVWCEILAAVPGARLVVKARGLCDGGTVERFRQAFAEHGVEERVELLPATQTLAEHLGVYGRVDLALDTFPYHGTTTTCEAMWMGVPVVTMRGTTHASRVGASLLGAVGLEKLVSGSAEEYVRVAVELARDEPRRRELRKTLRERMLHSPLMDEEGFAQEFQQSLRDMWRRWCAARGC